VVTLLTSTAPPSFGLAFVTAKYPRNNARFGSSLSLNADGTILAAGSPGDAAAASGVDGPENAPLTLQDAGAVDVLVREPGADWSTATKHYVKPIVADAGDLFGSAVSLSDDGNTMVVGANGEDSNGTNIDGGNAPSNDSVVDSGAAYLF